MASAATTAIIDTYFFMLPSSYEFVCFWFPNNPAVAVLFTAPPVLRAVCRRAGFERAAFALASDPVGKTPSAHAVQCRELKEILLTASGQARALCSHLCASRKALNVNHIR
jgi:hypothetical protein